MSLVKVLVGALSLTVSIIIAMTAAWANQNTQRVDLLDTRMATVEQHYAAIEADLHDIKDFLNQDYTKRKDH